MKFVTASQEGFLDIFKKKKPKEEETTDTYYRLPDYVIDDILGYIKTISDDDCNAILSKTINKTYKPQDLLTSYKTFISKILDMVGKQLISKWMILDKFEWHDQSKDPVDWDTNTIKLPALQKAVNDVGAISNSISSKPEFIKMVDWSNDDSKLVSGTLSDLGYNKNLIVEMVKLVCLFLDERNQDKLKLWYIQAEDHTDGYLYALYHVFQHYYDKPSAFPGLHSGEKVFLATEVACSELRKHLSKFIIKVAQQGQIGLI